MKKSKKILLTALSATLVTSLTSGIALTAFADEATKDHEFSGKYDAVFEDFDRDNISNTVAKDGDGVNLGEKPYMHVEYAALTADTSAGERNSQIYKQGSGTLGNFADISSITLRMRAPKGDVTLSELNFGLRGVDSEEAVFVKDFTEITDSDNEALPELTAEWQDYELSLATSYENTDKYLDAAETQVTTAALLGFHIFADVGETGTLDIASISINKTGNILLNDFIGGETVQDTAKNADSGTWWAGSSTGYIVKRAVNMTSGSFTVVKDSVVGNYAYAVIEADGDIEHLKVATTTDGTTWGTAAAYDGYSVNLSGNEKGFKFIYDGTAEGGVNVKRIYLTNVEIPVPAIAVPVIDASTVEVLEDFAVAQSGINADWDEMSTAPQLAAAGLEYRLSYSNGNKVEVKDGNLVLDATGLGDGYINYKFKSKTPVKGDYIVLKVKGEDGANLDAFRFALGNPEDVLSEVVWTNQMKAGVDLSVALLNDRNPYKTTDGWYYVVIDIEESGFKLFSEGYSIMDIYYGGTGKLYVNNVFFCNKIDVEVPNVEKDIEVNAGLDFKDAANDTYAGGFGISNDGYATTMSFDITPKGDGFNVADLRLQFVSAAGMTTCWGTENAEGTLKTTDGKTLDQLTFAKDVATPVVIDIEKSGIADFFWLHSHYGAAATNGNGTGAFTLTNVKLHTSTPVYAAKDIDYTKFDETKTHVVKDTMEITPNAIDNAEYMYNYVGEGGNKSYDAILFTVIPGANFDGSMLRFKVRNDDVTKVCYLKDLEGVITTDGKKFSEITFAEGVAVNFVINMTVLDGYDLEIAHVDFETNGALTGPLTLKDVKLVCYAAKDFITPVVEEYYAPKYVEQMGKLNLVKDNIDPEVSITTATTAKVGDEITIAYMASDNVTAAADLNVTVAVTKDGNAVTLTGNKFTAEEGVYTVTVTVRDANGNEARDTIQITVSETDGPAVVPPVTDSGCNGGCASTSVEGSIMMGGMTLMGLGILFAVTKVVRKKKEN